MKILFVHEVSWFNKVVFEMHDLPELLSLKGHEVHFLDFDEGEPRTKWRTLTTIETRAHEGSRVAVTTPPRFLPGILGRLLAIIIQPLVFVQLMNRIKPDVVITYSIPTSGWQIVTICKLRDVPVVARVIDLPHALRQTRFRPLVKWAERYVLRHVSFVSTHNEALQQYCLSLGASPTTSSVIVPGVDLERFYPAAPRLDLQVRLGIKPSDKVLIFMGTIFRFSGLFELLPELAPALHDNSALKFLILGDGEDFNRLQQLSNTLGLHNQVIMPGRIEYDSLADYIRLGHVALLPFRPEPVTHAALPNKVLQYLACGVPTVATPLDGLLSMAGTESGVHYSCTPHQMSIDAVRLMSEPTTIERMKHDGLNLIRRDCAWERQRDQFERTVISLLEKLEK